MIQVPSVLMRADGAQYVSVCILLDPADHIRAINSADWKLEQL